MSHGKKRTFLTKNSNYEKRECLANCEIKHSKRCPKLKPYSTTLMDYYEKEETRDKCNASFTYSTIRK